MRQLPVVVLAGAAKQLARALQQIVTVLQRVPDLPVRLSQAFDVLGLRRQVPPVKKRGGPKGEDRPPC
jgi:hypothetical protein